MLYYTVQCPDCHALLDVYVVCSGLGPTSARCRKCNKVFSTGRAEWSDMTTFDRVRFVGVSVMHACALGFLGGITGSLAAYALTHGFTSTVPRAAFFGASFYASAACWAVLTLLLQAVRFRRSAARALERADPPVASFTSLDFALQLKLLALVWVPVLACGLIGSTHG